MKWIKRLLIFMVIAGAALYGVYYFGMDYAAEKVTAKATEQLTGSVDMDQARSFVEQDAQLAGFVEEGRAAEQQGVHLPIASKGDAARVLIEKVGVSELATIQRDLESGKASVDSVLTRLQGDLTEEEILSLKVLVYKELYGNE